MELNKVYTGDALNVLKTFPDNVIQTCITSPPYFNLRTYNREGQIGLEQTPEEYINKLVEVFREVKRVLRPDGTCWINIGDTYAANRTYQVHNTVGTKGHTYSGGSKCPPGLKPKDLMLIPFKLAIALQEDGWWVRSDIIWEKLNPMTESVEDRPTRSHEYVFLMSKSQKYFYDHEAIKEPISEVSLKRINQKNFSNQTGGDKDYRNGVNPNRSMRQALENFAKSAGKRNKRDVWTLSSSPSTWEFCNSCGKFYQGKDKKLITKLDVRKVCVCGKSDAWVSHFASYPMSLIEPCILAGTSEKGNCSTCGRPWKRVIKRSPSDWPERKANNEPIRHGLMGATQVKAGNFKAVESETLGFEPQCDCGVDPVPAIALDIFMGSGTTGVVASKLGRNWVGIDLNEDYARVAEARIKWEMNHNG